MKAKDQEIEDQRKFLDNAIRDLLGSGWEKLVPYSVGVKIRRVEQAHTSLRLLLHQKWMSENEQ